MKHPLRDILIAIAEGKPVQQKPSTSRGVWRDVDTSCAFSLGLPGVEYRVKPKEMELRYRWVREDVQGSIDITSYYYRDKAHFYEQHTTSKPLQRIEATAREFEKDSEAM